MDKSLTEKLVDALREARAALSNCTDQIEQMQGMFDDSDGAIANALADAEKAEHDAGAALLAFKHDKGSAVAITVSGGVAEIADWHNWPHGLTVYLIDYDNDGETIDGEDCSIASETGTGGNLNGTLCQSAAEAFTA
jgi:hypothetical protein